MAIQGMALVRRGKCKLSVARLVLRPKPARTRMIYPERTPNGSEHSRCVSAGRAEAEGLRFCGAVMAIA